MASSIRFTSTSITKRKRSFTDVIDERDADVDRHIKRPHSMQENGSPTVGMRNFSWRPAQGLLTPDDSDDEQELEKRTWLDIRRRPRSTRRLSMSSVSSTKAHTGHMDDMEIDHSSDRSSLRNFRLNLLASIQTSNLRPVTTQLDERMPTPTANKVDSLSKLMNRRSWHSSTKTILSPVTKEEYGLLSPVEPNNSETVEAMELASDCFNSLTVTPANEDDSMEQSDYMGRHQCHPSSSSSSMSPSPSLSSKLSTPQDGKRTARLHLGFLTDCEKCHQHVPGHYSHIIWS